MKKRNLLRNPCWTADDLGQALPDSPHAVSVALPRWEDVIAYEEKDLYLLKSLKAIYPRFGLNPLVAKVANKAIKLYGYNKSTAWPYPNLNTDQQAQIHSQKKEKEGKTKIEKSISKG